MYKLEKAEKKEIINLLIKIKEEGFKIIITTIHTDIKKKIIIDHHLLIQKEMEISGTDNLLKDQDINIITDKIFKNNNKDMEDINIEKIIIKTDKEEEEKDMKNIEENKIKEKPIEEEVLIEKVTENHNIIEVLKNKKTVELATEIIENIEIIEIIKITEIREIENLEIIVIIKITKNTEIAIIEIKKIIQMKEIIEKRGLDSNKESRNMMKLIKE